jgi:hypothetical protein
MKRFVLGLACASAFTAIVGTQPSQASDCTDRWISPSTDQQECLDPTLQIVSQAHTSASDPGLDASEASEDPLDMGEIDFASLLDLEQGLSELIKGLEINALEGSATELVQHLKACQPYRYSFALAFMPEMAISQTVMGDSNGNCAVDVTLAMPDEGIEEPLAQCQFSPASIALLTDDQAYAEAQALDSNNWDGIGEMSPERGIAIFERECQSIQ